MSQLIHNRKALETIRRELRKEPTKAEQVLWNHLRNSQLNGRKFRRQHSIGNYVVDFYCPSERLVIEVDGVIHDKPEILASDKERNQVLNDMHIHVLRISNDAIFNEINEVLQIINGSSLFRRPYSQNGIAGALEDHF